MSGRIALVMAVFLCPSVGATAEVILVPGDQPTLQAGIDAAVNGDTVLVADGTYTGNGNRDLDFNGKAITLTSVNGRDSCIIDCQDLGRGFHFHSGETEDAVVEGLTIRNGYTVDAGAGILISGASPVIRGCLLQNNLVDNLYGTLGGGICTVGGAPAIVDNRIEDNYANEGAGGIHVLGGAPAIIDNEIHSNMVWVGGGGITCEDASVLIRGNDITENYVIGGNGGGIQAVGGTITVVDNRIIGNHTDDYSGGGISCLGGGSHTIANNLIQDNSSDGLEGYGGGGIHASGCRVSIVNNVIRDNSALEIGGGILVENGGSYDIDNNLIVFNVVDADPFGGGAGICCWWNAAAEIFNCTIAFNEILDIPSSTGGGIRCTFGGTAAVSDSIVWGNIPNQISGGTARYSDVQDGFAGTGNIDADPLFVTGPGQQEDFYLAQVPAGQPEDSPCLDAGSDLSENICFSTPSGTICMDGLSTRTDHLTDVGQVDMGYHHPIPTTLSAALICAPDSGTVPFVTNMTVELCNTYLGFRRRIAARIDLTTGSGSHWSSWKAGYTQLFPGESCIRTWNQAIPGYPAVLGSNEFLLLAEDVTPPPFNQPPYAPSGDTDTDECTVVGNAP